MIARFLLAFSLSILYGSCKEPQIDTLRYTAYGIIYDPWTQQWDTVIFHMLEIGPDGRYALARESEGGYTYCKGALPDSLQALIQSALAGQRYDSSYPYDAASGYYMWDGFSYILDYRANDQRNIIGFIPPEAPPKIKRLSSILDSFVTSPCLNKADTGVLSGYEAEARRLIRRLEKEPLPKIKVVEFEPAPIR